MISSRPVSVATPSIAAPSIATQRLFLLAGLLSWCSTLIVLRALRSDHAGFAFLLWNLFLAFLPLLFSAGLKTGNIRRQPILSALYFVPWLLFLPNAPYILTDLIHLMPRARIPLWYDLVLLLSCAGTGLLLGFLSVLHVQQVVENEFGKLSGWAIAIGAQFCCGFGVYLGRFLRWNSWDALTNPRALLRQTLQVSNPLLDSRALVFTLIFGATLTLAYLALFVLSRAIESTPQSTPDEAVAE